MDIIFKEGTVYLQGVKFGKRTWRKIWMMLFKPRPSGVGRLEFYTVVDNNTVTDQKKPGRQKSTERKVVRLSDCLSVTAAPKEHCPQGCTAFCVNTIQYTYILASTASQDWLDVLCLLAFQRDPEESNNAGSQRGNGLIMQNNDLYSSWSTDLTHPPNQYQVSVQSTEASRRCKLTGEYLLSAEQEELTLTTCGTGHTLYSWPYTLLRKFGQTEGGFSIEAGRRCQSGEGVFIFLSSHGAEIFQTILERCSVLRSNSVDIDKRSLCPQSPDIISTATSRPTGPPAYSPERVCEDTEEESDNHYSTINDSVLSFVKPPTYDSVEIVGDEDEDERCHSLRALSLDGDMEDSIYYNLRRSTLPLIGKDQLKPEMDDSECIYACVKKADSPSDSQLQPLSSSLCHPVPQLAPCNLLQSVPYALHPKPRYQHQLAVNNLIQPGLNTQTQAIDDMKETEEAVSSSTHVTPTEAPGSFKHRLAEIISKDLAKFQPPLLSGVGSSTFSP